MEKVFVFYKNGSPQRVMHTPGVDVLCIDLDEHLKYGDLSFDPLVVLDTDVAPAEEIKGKVRSLLDEYAYWVNESVQKSERDFCK